MTNKELQEKIAHLETELTEVKEMAVAMKKRADGGVFKPEDGQEYWFISGVGEIISCEWDNHWTDRNMYEIGNCFPTEQVAEDAIRVLKLIQKAKESQEGFVPDWESAVQNKFYLYFYDNGIWTGSNFLMNPTPIFGYWKDKSVCDQFIDENEKDLIWFFTEYRR